MVQPWYWNKVYSDILAEIDSFWWPKRWLFKKGIEVKRQMFNEGYGVHYFYDLFLFSHFRKKYLGGNAKDGIRVMATGSAPSSPEMKSLLTMVLAGIMIEGYSQTESTGVGFFASPPYPMDITANTHLGGIGMAGEFKMIDVPELDCYVSHKDKNGKPAPQGEILIRSDGNTRGYYKDPEQTRKMIDEDGWIHTGDVGELVPDLQNALRLFDRRGNYFKLNNGRWVTPDRLESLYRTCVFVKNLWIFADQTWGSLLAVVSVNNEVFLKELKSSGLVPQNTTEVDINSSVVKGHLLWHMQRTIEHVPKIAPFEVIKGLIIEPQDFAD